MAMITNDWLPAIQGEFKKPYYRELFQFVKEEYSRAVIYPPADDIFNAMHFTPLSEVKVLILGQDPYHNENQAHGLSFSVLPSQKEIPPSLQNIYKELQDDLGCYIPNNGYLKKWADQGVLLLNTVLTVRAHQANSHQGRGWEQFTDAIIQAVNAQDRPIVYMLWGRPAQSKIPMLTNPKHLILKAPHPSPLSAYRGFFGCRHFSQAKNCEDVSNGDIGYITSITTDDSDSMLTVDFGDGRVAEYDKSDLELLDLAYASTIHKSQGSEYKSVIINLQCAHAVMLVRPLVYTAITRAKERVIIVGERRALCIAIRRTDTEQRGTKLAARIRSLATACDTRMLAN